MSFHQCPKDKSLVLFAMQCKAFIPQAREENDREGLPAFPPTVLIHSPRLAHKKDFSGHLTCPPSFFSFLMCIQYRNRKAEMIAKSPGASFLLTSHTWLWKFVKNFRIQEFVEFLPLSLHCCLWLASDCTLFLVGGLYSSSDFRLACCLGASALPWVQAKFMYWQIF